MTKRSTIAVVTGLMACSFAVSGCAGSGSTALTPPGPAAGVRGPVSAPGGNAGSVKPHAGMTVTPSNLAVLLVGTAGAKTVKVADKGFSGTISSQSTCKGIATVTPSSGKGPNLTVTIAGTKAGTCTATFSDGTKSAKTTVAVTTTSLTLAGPLPSATSALVKITPGTTSVNVALSKCATGCSIPVPAPPGNDNFAVTISDANGKTLATSTATSATVTAAKGNTVPVAFVKTIGSIAWGAIPAGTGGTAFPAGGNSVKLTVKDVDGNVVTGTYANAIALGDTDKTGATSFAVNGAAGTSVTKSTDAVTLKYSGLDIVAATLSAASTGVTTANATFTPAIPNVVYTGPKVSNAPEVDNYSNAPNTTGFSGTFTATQAGWTNAPFNKPFTQGFAAIAAQANNCPSSSNPAFAVTPASGATGTAFTVSGSSALQAASDPSPFAGECKLTITGGAGKTAAVVLTYTASSVGVSGHGHGKVRPPR